MNTYSRRNFLKFGFLSTSVFVMSGCDLLTITTPRDTLSVVQYDLFPKAYELGIDTTDYLCTLLHHSHISQDDKTFIRNGVKWLNEKAFEIHHKRYTKLTETQRQSVLDAIAQTQWGENWMYMMLSYIFEAMLGDPIYGANKNEKGWKWLAFEGGIPRPTKAYI